ncbi:MAG: LysR family transcriptional regulator [Hyphomicrobiaceae bacterium]
MDRLHEIEVFIAVAEAGSFAKAGIRLRLSPPAVTRAIAALEDRLGARVFNRTTRSLALTDVGRHFLERARRVLADLDAAEKEAVGEAAVPQGHLTVTASVTFGRSVVTPIVRAFLAAHPRTTVALLLLDRVTSLIDEGIDAAVRIGPLPDSSLMARRIGTVRRLLVASPRYLARHGTLTAPAELRQHAVISFTGLGASHEWRFSDAGKAKSIRVEPRLQVNDAVAALTAAEAGEGIAMALSYMVADKVQKGKLVTVLDGMMPANLPVHLVHAQGRLMAPKLRAFIDFAVPRLTHELDKLSVPAADTSIR